MGNTKAGAKKGAKTLIAKYGEDYFCQLGKKGGASGTGLKGFALNRELASKAGAKGGRISRKRKVV